MTTGLLTRGDFEALLWDYLGTALPTGISEMIDYLAITPQQWAAFTDGERAEAQAALNLVKAETARRIWQEEEDPR